MSKKSKASTAKGKKSVPVKKVIKTKAVGGAKKLKPVPTKKSVAKKSTSASKSAVKGHTSSNKTKAKALVTKKVTKAPTKKAATKSVPKKLVKTAAKSAVKKPIQTKAAAPKKTTTSKPAAPAKKIAISKPAPVIPKKPNPEPKKVLKEAPKSSAKQSAQQEEKAKKQEETISKKQLLEKKSQEVLAINNTIPVKHKTEISASKIASISHSITNPVKRHDSYSVKPEKEPNGKYELEFVVHASADMLYEFLSTPSGLSEWFCDDLNIRNGIFTFIWEDQMQQARLLKTVELQLVRFQWVDKVDGSYFEFRIQRDDLTNDISLIITDFAESVSDRESSKLLWHSQIEKLMHVLGSIY